MSFNLPLPGWPPLLSEAHLDAITLEAKTYALSHGLIYLPPTTPDFSSAVHVSFSLFPAAFPRRLFQLAQRLQRIYNVLYSRIAMDEAFLDRIMGKEGIGDADEFVAKLWTGWKALRGQGLVQPLQLGLFRSDYLLHSPPGHPSASLKQVEFNTIAASSAASAARIAGLHRHLQASNGYYTNSPQLKPENFPPNDAAAGLAAGLAEAHKAYGNPGAYILFVVQSGERNVFDQRWLEYELLDKFSIHVLRQTFEQLAESAIVDPRTLALQIYPASGVLPAASAVEISTVYFRDGYTLSQFPTPTHYSTRFELERSRAIKCPTIPLQLAGSKKVQEVLTKPGVLEHFLLDSKTWGSELFTNDDLEELRANWMTMWCLSDDGLALGVKTSVGENTGVQRARELSSSLVLKPNREGGGNNVYKDDIPSFIDSLPPKEWAAWTAMEIIVPPAGATTHVVRSFGGSRRAVKMEVVSELGIFGWALFGVGCGDVKEKEVGWLLKTKHKDSNEGLVAAGFGPSVHDSMFLTDD